MTQLILGIVIGFVSGVSLVVGFMVYLGWKSSQPFKEQKKEDEAKRKRILEDYGEQLKTQDNPPEVFYVRVTKKIFPYKGGEILLCKEYSINHYWIVDPNIEDKTACIHKDFCKIIKP